MRILFIFALLFFLLAEQKLLFGQLDSTNIPLFIIDTNGSSIVDEPKTSADLKIIFNEKEYNSPLDSGNIYHGEIGIEIRGRYSASLPQKPYGFETRNSTGENLNISLFQMPAENDWILLANYNDKTFMRNSLSFELFRKMGHYAPRTQFCEVVLNGQYQGIYLLTEKIKRDPGRVDIATLNPDENNGADVTGGYIIKIDYFNDYDSWTGNYPPIGYGNKTVHFVYHYPKPELITSNQKTYIRDFIHQFESTLYAPNTAKRHRELYDLMDINSFIDYFIIGELSRNVDAYKKSSYFHKDKNGKLHAGPVWDFDWAWKNINECFFGSTDGSGWAYQVHKCDPWPVPPTWMQRLLEDPYFTQKLNERYNMLRASYLSEKYIFDYIDSVATVLDEAQNRHYRKWRTLGINVGAPEVDIQPTSYDGEIEKFKNWISKRLRWLDQQMPKFVVTDLAIDKIHKPDAIYPNPATSQITIASESIIYEYSILSPNGKILKSEYINSSMIHLNIKDLEPGIHFLAINCKDGTRRMSKFIKVK